MTEKTKRRPKHDHDSQNAVAAQGRGGHDLPAGRGRDLRARAQDVSGDGFATGEPAGWASTTVRNFTGGFSGGF